MSLTMTLSAAWVSSMTLAQAGPVQTFSNAVDPSRSEGIISNRQYVPNTDPRAELLDPAPWPDHRVDSPAREQLGRLWHSRFPVGNRTPMNELTRVFDGGPGEFGAPPEALDAVIFVKTSIPGVGVVAISPWDKLGDQTINRIREDNPRLGLRPSPAQLNGAPLLHELQTEVRSKRLLAELKQAQRLWLKEQGYILNVRTHVNPRRIYGPATRPASGIEPRGIIRVQPQPKDDSKLHVEAQPTESETMRVSTPAHAQPPTPIRVVEVSVPSSEASPVIESES